MQSCLFIIVLLFHQVKTRSSLQGVKFQVSRVSDLLFCDSGLSKRCKMHRYQQRNVATDARFKTPCMYVNIWHREHRHRDPLREKAPTWRTHHGWYHTSVVQLIKLCRCTWYVVNFAFWDPRAVACFAWLLIQPWVKHITCDLNTTLQPSNGV